MISVSFAAWVTKRRSMEAPPRPPLKAGGVMSLAARSSVQKPEKFGFWALSAEPATTSRASEATTRR